MDISGNVDYNNLGSRSVVPRYFRENPAVNAAAPQKPKHHRSVYLPRRILCFGTWIKYQIMETPIPSLSRRTTGAKEDKRLLCSHCRLKTLQIYTDRHSAQGHEPTEQGATSIAEVHRPISPCRRICVAKALKALAGPECGLNTRGVTGQIPSFYAL